MKVFSKKNIFFFLVFIVCCVLFLFPLFHFGTQISHDGQSHLIRIAAYQKALQSGQFPVRWASDLNYSFGSPLFIFYYPLPYYLGVGVHLIGFSLEDTLDILMGFAFIGSYFTFYLWTKQSANKLVACLGALIYLLSPYHLLDMYVRSDIGELFAYALLPLVFYFIDQDNTANQFKSTIWGGITFALLILSHNGVSLIFSPVIVIYIILRYAKNVNLFIKKIKVIILGLFFSAFFWIPALYDKRFIANLGIFDNFYKNNFINLKNLIYSSWGFGTSVSRHGGLAPQLGVFETAILAISILSQVRFKNKKIFFWIIVSLGGIFLSLPYSNFLYQHMKFLRDFQFPWRFLVLVSFSSAVLLVLVIKKVTVKVFIFLVAIIFICNVPYIQVKGFTHHSDAFYFNFQDITFYHGEAISIWSDGNKTNFPKSPLELIAGQGKISSLKKHGTVHSFRVDGTTETGFLDNTIYFPGWQVRVDKQVVPIQFQDAHHRGLITFNVPAGKHNVVIFYKETAIHLFSDILSFVTLIAVMGWLALYMVKKYVC